MLAKVIASKEYNETSFKVKIDSHAFSSKLCVTETNCLFGATAAREMKATSDMNGRVKNPVYHFVVSWPAHENPIDQQVFEAGRAAIEALGMQEHEYFAAVHRDTDNIHGHFLVNRIHPDTYKGVYPDRDFYKLDKVMREMELKQGWSHDDGVYSVHERNGVKVVDWKKEKKSDSVCE